MGWLRTEQVWRAHGERAGAPSTWHGLQQHLGALLVLPPGQMRLVAMA